MKLTLRGEDSDEMDDSSSELELGTRCNAFCVEFRGGKIIHSFAIMLSLGKDIPLSEQDQVLYRDDLGVYISSSVAVTQNKDAQQYTIEEAVLPFLSIGWFVLNTYPTATDVRIPPPEMYLTQSLWCEFTVPLEHVERKPWCVADALNYMERLQYSDYRKQKLMAEYSGDVPPPMPACLAKIVDVVEDEYNAFFQIIDNVASNAMAMMRFDVLTISSETYSLTGRGVVDYDTCANESADEIYQKYLRYLSLLSTEKKISTTAYNFYQGCIALPPALFRAVRTLENRYMATTVHTPDVVKIGQLFESRGWRCGSGTVEGGRDGIPQFPPEFTITHHTWIRAPTGFSAPAIHCNLSQLSDKLEMPSFSLFECDADTTPPWLRRKQVEELELADDLELCLDEMGRGRKIRTEENGLESDAVSRMNFSTQNDVDMND
jgi:hypothetical protein